MDIASRMVSHMSALLSGIFGWAVKIGGGQFIPQTCPSCRTFWMVGLGMGAVLIFVYLRGPKAH